MGNKEKGNLTLDDYIRLMRNAGDQGIKNSAFLILGFDGHRDFISCLEKIKSHLEKPPIVQLNEILTTEQLVFMNSETAEMKYWENVIREFNNIYYPNGWERANAKSM